MEIGSDSYSLLCLATTWARLLSDLRSRPGKLETDGSSHVPARDAARRTRETAAWASLASNPGLPGCGPPPGNVPGTHTSPRSPQAPTRRFHPARAWGPCWASPDADQLLHQTQVMTFTAGHFNSIVLAFTSDPKCSTPGPQTPSQ